MQQRYIRIGQLASQPGRTGMLPVSAPTIWRWVKLGRFPAPVRLGPQVTAWPLRAVEEFLQQRAAEAAEPGNIRVADDAENRLLQLRVSRDRSGN